MDEKSLRTLEFSKVLHILAGYTSFSAGQELALQLRPTTDLYAARQRQTETREAALLLDTHTTVTIGGARDVRRAVANAERGFTLPAEDLLDIRSTIAAARTLKRQLLKVEDAFPTLADIAHLIEDCPGIVSSISDTIDDRGEVLDSASPKLAKIRQDLHATHGRIQDKLQKIVQSSMNQYLQEPIITMRNGRYVIPLKSEAKGRLKGIVHDHSGSGATLWLEPIGTVDLNNEYRGLQIKEQEEIERILAALSAQIAEQGDSIKRVVERMAELDLILARARYALQINAIEPTFDEWRTFAAPKPPKHANEREKWTPPPPNMHPGSTIWIKGARHPLLDPETVVPTNLTLDEETFIVLITGPNTGGKTVSLKTMGLMALMAQAGLHIPATDARLTIFDNVFADIGDEQSIEQSLSTFSAHITNIIRILGQADGRSLVLFDELGSGTDPGEGAALAQSITNFLRDKGATTFIATHYPELKVYASQTKGATNASLLFDIETLSPTYEMTIGIPGKSNAFAIARRLGLDETILQDAMSMVGAGSNTAETVLDEIYQLRDKIDSEEASTRLALKEAERERDILRMRLAYIEEERQQILAEAQKQAEGSLTAVQIEVDRARRQLRDAESLTKIKRVKQRMEQVEEELHAEPEMATAVTLPPSSVKKPKPVGLREGDVVQVVSLNVKGEILSIQKGEAQLQVGRMQMRAKLKELELLERPSANRPPESESSGITVQSNPSASIELDIRGRRVEDGLSALEKYLDAAFLSHLPWVRIIHGKGTGRLREAVRQSLRHNSHVTSWEQGKDGEGGDGVTVAKLVQHE